MRKLCIARIWKQATFTISTAFVFKIWFNILLNGDSENTITANNGMLLPVIW